MAGGTLMLLAASLAAIAGATLEVPDFDAVQELNVVGGRPDNASNWLTTGDARSRVHTLIVYEGWDAAPRIERALGDMPKVRHMTITGVDLETPVDTWMLKGTGWYDQVVRGRAPMASIKVMGKSLRTLPFAQGDPFNDIILAFKPRIPDFTEFTYTISRKEDKPNASWDANTVLGVRVVTEGNLVRQLETSTYCIPFIELLESLSEKALRKSCFDLFYIKPGNEPMFSLPMSFGSVLIQDVPARLIQMVPVLGKKVVTVVPVTITMMVNLTDVTSVPGFTWKRRSDNPLSQPSPCSTSLTSMSVSFAFNHYPGLKVRTSMRVKSSDFEGTEIQQTIVEKFLDVIGAQEAGSIAESDVAAQLSEPEVMAALLDVVSLQTSNLSSPDNSSAGLVREALHIMTDQMRLADLARSDEDSGAVDDASSDREDAVVPDPLAPMTPISDTSSSSSEPVQDTTEPPPPPPPPPSPPVQTGQSPTSPEPRPWAPSVMALGVPLLLVAAYASAMNPGGRNKPRGRPRSPFHSRRVHIGVIGTSMALTAALAALAAKRIPHPTPAALPRVHPPAQPVRTGPGPSAVIVCLSVLVIGAAAVSVCMARRSLQRLKQRAAK
ncbi:START domain-containing protein [Plasmodiophora brassicae]